MPNKTAAPERPRPERNSLATPLPDRISPSTPSSKSPAPPPTGDALDPATPTAPTRSPDRAGLQEKCRDRPTSRLDSPRSRGKIAPARDPAEERLPPHGDPIADPAARWHRTPQTKTVPDTGTRIAGKELS